MLYFWLNKLNVTCMIFKQEGLIKAIQFKFFISSFVKSRPVYFYIPFEFVDFLLVFLNISPGDLFTSNKTTILQAVMSLQERLQALHTDVVTLI